MDRDVFVDADSARWWLLERDAGSGIENSRRQLGEAFTWTDAAWYQDRSKLEELYTVLETHNARLLSELDSAADDDRRKQWIDSVIELAASRRSSASAAVPPQDPAATAPDATSGVSLPLDREFAFERGPFPAGPLLITVAGGVKFKGTVAPGQGAVEERAGVTHSTKGSSGHSAKEALKFSYEKKVAEVFGQDLKFTAEREQGKGWKIGGQVGGKEWALKLAGQLDPTKPVTAKVSRKWKETWHLPELDLSLIGEFELAVDLGFGLNPAAGAAAAAGVGEVAVASTFAGEACTVSVIGAAAVAVAAGVAVVGVLAVGLYMIGKDLNEGKMEAIGYRFADGYAGMITDLTAAQPKITAPDAGDWKSRLEKARAVASGQDASYGTAFANDEAYQCGRMAVFQDVLKATGSPDALRSFATELRAKYGEEDSKRLDAIRDELYGQVKAGGGEGVGLVGVSPGR